MRVLVTGGNGYVGRHLVQALLERGDSVRVLALPGEDTFRLSEQGVDVRRGDIRLRGPVDAAVGGVDAVVHLAAMMHVWRPLADYCAVNVTGTELVARAALASGVQRFVHMSSSSVYGPAATARAGGRAVEETAPLDPFPDPYPVSKAAADQLVLHLAATGGLPAVVVRPDQIFGPGDHLHFGAFVRRLQRGRGLVVGRGDNALPLVYVTDVVQALLLALDHDGAIGEAFNITNDAPLTQLEFLEAIARCLGVEPRWTHLPYRPLLAAAATAERATFAWRGSDRPPLTMLGVSFLGTDARFSVGKARRHLGYRPEIALRDGVRRAVEGAPVESHEVDAAPIRWSA